MQGSRWSGRMPSKSEDGLYIFWLKVRVTTIGQFSICLLLLSVIQHNQCAPATFYPTSFPLATYFRDIQLVPETTIFYKKFFA